MKPEPQPDISDVSPIGRAATRLSTFYVNRMFFGIDVLKVQEVLRLQPMTRIPKAPEVIEGLINLRGQIVVAIDMRKRLGLSQRPPEMIPMNIVVRTSDGAVSLLADEIGDVTEVDSCAFEGTPASLSPPFQSLIRGVYKLKDELLLILDEERCIDLESEP